MTHPLMNSRITDIEYHRDTGELLTFYFRKVDKELVRLVPVEGVIALSPCPYFEDSHGSEKGENRLFGGRITDIDWDDKIRNGERNILSLWFKTHDGTLIKLIPLNYSFSVQVCTEPDDENLHGDRIPKDEQKKSTMKLWEVRYSYSAYLVLADTKNRAIEIVKEQTTGWENHNVTVSLITKDFTSELCKPIFGE